MRAPAPLFRRPTRVRLCHALWLLMFSIYLLQGWILWQTQPRYLPTQIKLTLEKGESRILGQRELAAAQADRQHLRLSRDENGLWFIQNISTNKQLLLHERAQEVRASNNEQAAHALTNVQYMVVGRTHFDLDVQNRQLQLTPSHRIMLFSRPEQTLPAGLEWEWQSTHYRQIPAKLSAGLLLACALLLLLAQRRPQYRVPASLLLGACGLWATLVPPPLAQALGLGLLSSLLLLTLQTRPGISTALALCLLACGLLSQLELALGGMESIWSLYYQKSCSLQALATGICGLLVSAKPRLPRLKIVDACLLGLAVLALILMLLEALLGSETGVFGIQPVEFAKTALVALSSHALALYHAHGQQHATPLHPRALVWHWLWPILVLLAIVSLTLVRVSDFSPLLLLLVWATVCALGWCLARQQYWSAGTMLAVMACPVLAILALHQSWLQLPEQFYAGRFLVWLEPHLHPHTGQQFLLGVQAISAGGWTGADQHLGLTTLGMPLGSLMQIPALQDDFAPAFFLNRHGLGAALVLWLMQAGFLCSLLIRASRSWQWSAKVRDFRLAWHARFYAMVLIGAAGFLFGQFLLAWSTNLGMLPVMGQPMSFLSSGGSHLLFFLLPLLGFSALYAPHFEE